MTETADTNMTHCFAEPSRRGPLRQFSNHQSASKPIGSTIQNHIRGLLVPRTMHRQLQQSGSPVIVCMITIVDDDKGKPAVQTHNVNVMNGQPRQQLCDNPAWPVARSEEPNHTNATQQPVQHTASRAATGNPATTSSQQSVQHGMSRVPTGDRDRARQLFVSHQRRVEEPSTTSAALPDNAAKMGTNEPPMLQTDRSPVAPSTRTFNDTIFGEVQSRTPTRAEPTGSPRRVDPTIDAILSDYESRKRDAEEADHATYDNDRRRTALIPRRFQQDDPFNVSMANSSSRTIVRGATDHPLLLSRVTRSGNSQYSVTDMPQQRRRDDTDIRPTSSNMHGTDRETNGPTIGHVTATEGPVAMLPMHPTRLSGQPRGTVSGHRQRIYEPLPPYQGDDCPAKAIAGHLLGLANAPFEIVSQSAANAFMRIRDPGSMGTNRAVRFGVGEIYEISRRVHEHRHGTAPSSDRPPATNHRAAASEKSDDTGSQPPSLCTDHSSIESDTSSKPPSLITPSDSDDEETVASRRRRGDQRRRNDDARVRLDNAAPSINSTPTAHIFTTNGGGDADEERSTAPRPSALTTAATEANVETPAPASTQREQPITPTSASRLATYQARATSGSQSGVQHGSRSGVAAESGTRSASAQTPGPPSPQARRGPFSSGLLASEEPPATPARAHGQVHSEVADDSRPASTPQLTQLQRELEAVRAVEGRRAFAVDTITRAWEHRTVAANAMDNRAGGGPGPSTRSPGDRATQSLPTHSPCGCHNGTTRPPTTQEITAEQEARFRRLYRESWGPGRFTRTWRAFWHEIGCELRGGTPQYGDGLGLDSDDDQPPDDGPPVVPTVVDHTPVTAPGENEILDSAMDLVRRLTVHTRIAINRVRALMLWGFVEPSVDGPGPGMPSDRLERAITVLTRTIRALRVARSTARTCDTMTREVEGFGRGVNFIVGTGGGAAQEFAPCHGQDGLRIHTNRHRHPDVGRVVQGTADGTFVAGTVPAAPHDESVPTSDTHTASRDRQHPPQTLEADDEYLDDEEWQRTLLAASESRQAEAKRTDPDYIARHRPGHGRTDPVITRSSAAAAEQSADRYVYNEPAGEMVSAQKRSSEDDDEDKLDQSRPHKFTTRHGSESYTPANEHTAHSLDVEILVAGWALSDRPSDFRDAASGDDRTSLSLHDMLTMRLDQLEQLTPWINRHPDRFIIAPDIAAMISPGATSIPPVDVITGRLRTIITYIEEDPQGQTVTIQRWIRGWLIRRTVRWTYSAHRQPPSRWVISHERARAPRRSDATAAAKRNTININSGAGSTRPTRGAPGVHYHPAPEQSHHHHHAITPSVDHPIEWTLDSGAGASAMKDPLGLTDVNILRIPVLVKGVIDSATMSVTTEAHLDNVSVLFDQRFNTNCLAYSGLIDAGWAISYAAATDAYQVVSHSGVKLCFQRYRLRTGDVTNHYVCHPQLPYVDPFDLQAWTLQRA